MCFFNMYGKIFGPSLVIYNHNVLPKSITSKWVIHLLTEAKLTVPWIKKLNSIIFQDKRTSMWWSVKKKKKPLKSTQ